MRAARLLAAAVIAALLVAPSPAHSGSVVLDGVTVQLQPGTRKVVTVNRTSGHLARVTYWRRLDGRWERITRATGRIGYGGLVPGDERVQGTGTAPRWFLQQMMGRLDPDLRPLIAIGP